MTDPLHSESIVSDNNGTTNQTMLAVENTSQPNVNIAPAGPSIDPSSTAHSDSIVATAMQDSFGHLSVTKGMQGLPPTRPTRESVLRRLSEALMRRSLTKIDLSQRGLVSTDARLVKLALLQNASLSVLKLGYNNLSDAGVITLVPGISKHRALASLDLGFNNVGDEGCKALANSMANGTLQTLYLSGNIIGEDGALALADIIRRGCRLRRLHLTGNRLGPDGVKALTEAISEDETRRSHVLDERDEVSEDQEMLPNGDSSTVSSQQPLSASQETQQKGAGAGGMEELFLGGTSMGPSGCFAVARMLERSTSLRVISLANCGIGDDELATLAESIKKNRNNLPLEALQLSFNNITGRGLEALMNAIWGSKTLRKLQLDNNEIGDRGAQQVAAILSSISSLEVLDLGFNSIKSLGMRTLMKMVAETQHLKSLSISGNNVDTVGAKAVAYGLAYNRSLKSFFLDHCGISHEGQRHIAAGVVSNSGIILRKLTGFRIGIPIVTIGLPSSLEHWTNEQVLNFIHLMWEKAKQEREQEREDEKELDPLHFLPDPSGGEAGENRAVSSGPLDATVVVEVAKRAFASLGENGHDVFSRQRGLPMEPSFESPLTEDAIMVESSEGGDSIEQEQKANERPLNNMFSGDISDDPSTDTNPTNPSRSFVAPPQPKAEPAMPDPGRKRRIVEWLCRNIRHLNELSLLPFNSGELWRLHQHYFTPVVNESGGSISGGMHSLDRIVSSVPEVSRVSDQSAITPSTQSTESGFDHSAVPISDPAMAAPPPGGASLPMLKRKVSYRFLGDAAVVPHGLKPEYRHDNSGSVSKLIEDGTLGHSMPPKTKRARRNKTRISFLPRVKAKLDSYLDVCHEKALILMRQLHFVEKALLSGEINPRDPSCVPVTHLTGVLASEAEMILIDMM
mmetsp:Transcript_613/g.868  ORF Transcript_613/g.868 Transcript_613/m.868 type:complete len:910 (+) Transcript_613:96-2825(+)